MMQKDRLSLIRQQVIDERTVVVSALSKEYSVTEETIRRDLEKLEQQGFLTRTHGGAVVNTDFMNQSSIHFYNRLQINSEAKNSIADLAFAYLKNESIIGVDSSSTVMEFIRRIKSENNRTIFTNSVVALTECIQSNVNVLSTGGYLNKSSLSLQGVGVQDTISKYHLDIMFISCKALSIDKGVFDTNENEAAVKQAMIKQSNSVVLLVDDSKFDKASFVRLLGLEQITAIITNKCPSSEWVKFCAHNKIELLYPSKQ